jgi:hypothetical protein
MLFYTKQILFSSFFLAAVFFFGRSLKKAVIDVRNERKSFAAELSHSLNNKK